MSACKNQNHFNLTKYFRIIIGHLRIWKIDVTTNKLHVLNASLGKIRRNFTAMKISADDSMMFVGTTSGDVMKLRLNCGSKEFNKPTLIGCFGRHNPKKQPGKDCEKYMNGVRDLLICPNNERHLVIGAGDGTIELVEERNVVIRDYPSPTWPMFKAVNEMNKCLVCYSNCQSINFQLKRKKVNGCVTSLQFHGHQTIYIATDLCEVYTLEVQTFVLKLQITCNSSIVNDIVFPRCVVLSEAREKTVKSTFV